MVYAIDRLDNSVAVCECLTSGKRFELDVQNLPRGAKEGDVLRRDGNGYVVDSALTKQRRDELTDRMNMLFKKHGQDS